MKVPPILALLLVPPVAGCAFDTAQCSRPGPYLGLAANGSFESFDPPGGLRSDNSEIGGSVKAGYRLNETFAVEGIAEMFPDFRLKGATGDTDVDLMDVGLVLKASLIPGPVQPYVLGGGGVCRFDNNDVPDADGNGTFYRAGAGLDLYVNPSCALYAEGNYNWPTGDLRPLEHLDFQVGLIIRF